jgi:thymidylate synthase (FAD)
MKVELVVKSEGQNKYKGLSSEQIIAAIARHGVIKSDNGKLVIYLMDKKHWSPLDMINFVFEVETSRAMGRELLRHRSMNFQESSQRYQAHLQTEPIELRKQAEHNRQSSTDVFDPVISLGWEHEVKASEAIEQHLKQTNKLYQALMGAGVARECARFILPECTTTTITTNGTLRSWLAFLNVRMDDNAQKEIRLIAEQIGNALEQELPNVFSQIQWQDGLFM